jgi:hypothetical protein
LWKGGAEDVPALLVYVEPVSCLLRAFQLFKPGRFVAGDTFFFFPNDDASCGTLSVARCSEMSIDWQFIGQFKPHYSFESKEIPFLLAFIERLNDVWPKAQKYPHIDLALHRYCEETALYGNAVSLMVSLETLLVPEEEGISFKLCQRVANLLGEDASKRKELSKQIREFYALRSRIVHGAKLRSRELGAAQQLDILREITRRVLLVVIALAADVALDSSFYEMLNDMCLDDDLRRSMQARASTLLHC